MYKWLFLVSICLGSECGVESSLQARIVGGSIISTKPPWIGALIRLEDDDVPNLICGVTVINEYWLATATHCFIGAYDLQDFYITMDLQYRTDLYSSKIKF